MIGYLSGTVLHGADGVLTVLCGAVGYELRVGATLALENPAGSTVRLWVHVSARDNGWDLYGFQGRESRELFRMLQKVPQVGPRTAQAVLETFRPADLVRVVTAGDIHELTEVPGIGKKTAQRIVVELRDRMLNVDVSGSGGEVAAGGREAVQALLALGYAQGDAMRRVQRAVEAGAAAGDTEAIVRAVLTAEAAP